jgi:SAM-dependent methyltransferase
MYSRTYNGWRFSPLDQINTQNVKNLHMKNVKNLHMKWMFQGRHQEKVRRIGDQGKVIAVDIQQSMLDRIAKDIQARGLHNQARGLHNVELVPGTPSDPKLPDRSVDLVLIANAYHEFSDPTAVMGSVGRCLKPNGRVVVIEYAEEKNDDDPVAGLYTITLPQIRSEVEALGWQPERVLDFLPMQSRLIFTKTRQTVSGRL